MQPYRVIHQLNLSKWCCRVKIKYILYVIVVILPLHDVGDGVETLGDGVGTAGCGVETLGCSVETPGCSVIADGQPIVD